MTCEPEYLHIVLIFHIFYYKLKGMRIGGQIPKFDEGIFLGFEGSLTCFMIAIEA